MINWTVVIGCRLTASFSYWSSTSVHGPLCTISSRGLTCHSWYLYAQAFSCIAAQFSELIVVSVWNDNKWHNKISFLNCNQHFGYFKPKHFSECCLIKLLPFILFEKYINILALEIASPGNRHCANCIGALSFPISKKLGTWCLRRSPGVGRRTRFAAARKMSPATTSSTTSRTTSDQLPHHRWRRPPRRSGRPPPARRATTGRPATVAASASPHPPRATGSRAPTRTSSLARSSPPDSGTASTRATDTDATRSKFWRRRRRSVRDVRCIRRQPMSPAPLCRQPTNAHWRRWHSPREVFCGERRKSAEPTYYNSSVLMSMWSLRWHFTNKSVTGAP